MLIRPIDLILRQAHELLRPEPPLVVAPEGVADLTAYRLRKPLTRPVDAEAATTVLDLEALRARRTASRLAAAQRAGHPSTGRRPG